MVEHGSDRTEQLEETESACVHYNPASEELARVDLKPTHEVENQREARNL